MEAPRPNRKDSTKKHVPSKRFFYCTHKTKKELLRTSLSLESTIPCLRKWDHFACNLGSHTGRRFRTRSRYHQVKVDPAFTTKMKIKIILEIECDKIKKLTVSRHFLEFDKLPW
jgi:hypothetical protein